MKNNPSLSDNTVIKADKTKTFKKTDSRVKLLIIVLLTTLAVISKDIMYLGIVVILAVIVDLCLKIDIINLILRLKHFLWLLLFIAIVQSLTIKGGRVFIAIGSVSLLTSTGLRFALEFIFRMAVILFAGAIAASTEGHEMLDGMQMLKVPYILIFMASVALKNLPVFREEFSSRMNAISMRGIDIKKLKLSKKLKVYGYLLSPTVSGAIIKSEELSRSMETRGFKAMKKRTMLRELKMTALDWFAVILSLAIFATFIALMFTFGAVAIF